ncbi:hypothetical protein [Noviherbaspirillum saxi]|uniref:Uncharacterized protein n=1 Tax=Noviherbaspirillum saxi TaxID=2320863 RepID=A0A3A3FEU2_9BURK|nr:hypothetical protein [Noviherbaspirillum saxi]RJF91861.1 hypothetical protein D3871_24600 [Noviherbaspirillum saxi]
MRKITHFFQPTTPSPRLALRRSGARHAFALVAAVALSTTGALYAPSADAANGPFTTTYSGRTSGDSCNTSRQIVYYAPSTGTAPFPLVTWTHGTLGIYNDAATHEYLQYMADAGFVAASIQYDNDTDVSGSELVQKARCIFDAANPNSAINKLDALAVVDVSKGIFASGLSQGSLMAHLSRNFHSQVRGAWLSGTGDTGLFSVHLTELHYTNTALVNIRATNGQQDAVFGPGYCPGNYAAGNAQQLKHATGVGYGSACSVATSHPNNTANVSWYVVPGYMHTTDFGFWNKHGQCSDPWSRCAVKDWAKTLVTP